MSAPAKRLRRKAAAEYTQATFGIGTPSSLATPASKGTGPEMQYIGRIPTYSIEALDAWALAKLSEPVCKTQRRKPAPKAEAAE
jgi:hypothetical protein